ncbi:MAG: beta-lactamase family protein [Gammaproteobacteria bacterium]|jgi:CubicO group peptidase (beta-lactamase class C family)|nr:beta-lactamase family protein [Gammaproteobacteria bacterium]MBT3867830.1 beta-lactamase family protein [Gammaproteobacteria bacterium]MBT4378332.1 beta-lactamase family protein [Gammaproteobacteria bacterium]MBT4616436.1 beta-lactamase family protein [Gammaproteobacteria bacterium]MBT5197602.1 beta-lactamase family protein [Gammaproteobacteria bacterium]
MSKTMFTLLLAPILAVLTSIADATPAGSSLISQTVEKHYIDLDRNDSPGCSVGWARDGRLIYRRQFGMANLEHDIAIDSNTVFRTGSTSKQFVAASVAMLSLQGELDLDADIHTILPDLPDYGTTVTIRQMINHSSGIQDYFPIVSAVYGDEDGNFYPSEKALEYIFRMKRLEFEPGSRYSYSNSAYLLLALAVEAVSGLSMREFAQQNIFGPLGMDNTHFHDNHRELVKNRADGYSKIEGHWQKHNTNFAVVGDGGVFSTIEDLVIWYNNFADNRLPGGDELLGILTTPASYTEVPAKYRTWPIEYAFGNMYLEFGGKTLFGHPGGFVGFVATPFRIQETNEIMVSLCNYRFKGNVNRVLDTVEKIYGSSE